VTCNRSVPQSLAACILVFAACALNGCGCNAAPSGLVIRDKASLQPDRLTLKQVDLKLAGSKFRAEIKQTVKGDEVRIDLLSEGGLIESEVYKSTDEAFSVVDTGGDRYDPPIILVKYGMHVGDTWKWSGKLVTGPVAREAKANVRSSTEGLTIDGAIVRDTVKIEVELSIESGRAGDPSTRKLTFWIAPDMGVVKRAFADYSLRTPVED
jgi:hypothetical protein